MKRRRSILMTILALLLVVPSAWIMWPEGPLDLSKEEEPFKSMVLPPKKLVSDVYEFPSDVRVMITDGAGRDFHFRFPMGFNDPWTYYPHCQWTKYGPGGGIREVKNCPRARAIISRLIKDSQNRDKASVATLEYFSKRPPDTWRLIIHRAEWFLRGGSSGIKDCPF